MRHASKAFEYNAGLPTNIYISKTLAAQQTNIIMCSMFLTDCRGVKTMHFAVCNCVSSLCIIPWRWGPCGRNPCCAGTAVHERCPWPGWSAHSSTGKHHWPTAAPGFHHWCTGHQDRQLSGCDLKKSVNFMIVSHQVWNFHVTATFTQIWASLKTAQFQKCSSGFGSLKIGSRRALCEWQIDLC